jgi:hypothetical protein
MHWMCKQRTCIETKQKQILRCENLRFIDNSLDIIATHSAKVTPFNVALQIEELHQCIACMSFLLIHPTPLLSLKHSILLYQKSFVIIHYLVRSTCTFNKPITISLDTFLKTCPLNATAFKLHVLYSPPNLNPAHYWQVKQTPIQCINFKTCTGQSQFRSLVTSVPKQLVFVAPCVCSGQSARTAFTHPPSPLHFSPSILAWHFRSKVCTHRWR